MDSLPTETILHIISFLSGKDLKHSSLVSTRFTPLAQQALFKTVVIITDEGPIGPKDFVDFVDAVLKRPPLGLMINRLIIDSRFDQCLHYQPLVQLLEQVHNLRELLCNGIVHPPCIPFRPHQFPRLYRIKWPLLGSGTDILHTILPYSPVVDLSLYCCPERLQSKVAFAALLKLSPPQWVNNLVRYTGTSYLIEGLSEDAKLLHFCSYNSLSEESLQGLASKRLLSLHATLLEEQYIPPSLLPSLFPNLQSIMWFTVQLSSAVRYFSSKIANYPLIVTFSYCINFKSLRLVLLLHVCGNFATCAASAFHLFSQVATDAIAGSSQTSRSSSRNIVCR